MISVEVVIIEDGSVCTVVERRISVGFSEQANRAGVVQPRYSGEFRTAVIAGGQAYTGEYEVVPRVSEQTLPTALKTMRRDVTVHGVPRYDVENEYGTTVSIALEV